jgi:hypothetical protein
MTSPQSLIDLKGVFRTPEMSQDPSSTFGGLLAGCISDAYQKQDRKTLAEGVLFMILGAACSVITTYVLSLAGVLV